MTHDGHDVAHCRTCLEQAGIGADLTDSEAATRHGKLQAAVARAELDQLDELYLELRREHPAPPDVARLFAGGTIDQLCELFGTAQGGQAYDVLKVLARQGLQYRLEALA